MEIRLSKNQKTIVETLNGSILVLASAGSGKTRVLTERIRHLFSSQSGTFKILALTFTNKAADEMQSRLKDISITKDRTFIGTMHKFCLELIRSKGVTIGINEMPHIFERENDRREILLEVFENNPIFKNQLLKLKEKDRQMYIYNALNFISQQKRNLYGVLEQTTLIEDDIKLLLSDYNAVLASQNAIDFDDVICLAYKILIERPAVAELYRKMYKYICIDEAQDLNFAQYELIKALCGRNHNNVLMVGDPNQAIYGFNGSSKTYMTDYFVKDFSAMTILLSENYRSSIAVLDAARKLIPNSVEISNAVLKGEFLISECKNETEEAAFVAAKIESLIQNIFHEDIEGEISYDKIAVLARNKYVFSSLESEFIKRVIPYEYKRTNDSNEPESDLMKIYSLGLRIIVNPLDKLHFIQLCQLLNFTEIPITNHSNGIDKLNSLLNSLPSGENKDEFLILLESWKMVELNINNFLKALEKILFYINSNY